MMSEVNPIVGLLNQIKINCSAYSSHTASDTGRMKAKIERVQRSGDSICIEVVQQNPNRNVTFQIFVNLDMIDLLTQAGQMIRKQRIAMLLDERTKLHERMHDTAKQREEQIEIGQRAVVALVNLLKIDSISDEQLARAIVDDDCFSAGDLKRRLASLIASERAADDPDEQEAVE